MKKQATRAVSLLLCGIAVLSFASCQTNPDSSIVKNKDLDKLIDAAQNPGDGNVGMDALAGKYDTYQATLKDEKLGVTVNADARVDIPGADRLSVLRVEQAPVTQEQLDAVRQALIGDAQLYDAAVLYEQIKASLEENISYYRDAIAEKQSHPELYSAEDIASAVREYQKNIDALQAAYESAATATDPYKYPTDGKIRSVAELSRLYPEGYSMKHALATEGSSFAGIGTDDGDYFTLNVTNSDNWGNRISFTRDPVGIYVTSGILPNEASYWREGEDPPLSVTDNDGKAVTGDPHPTDRVTLSLADAKAQADAFLEQTGLDVYRFYEGDRYYECVSYGYTPETADNLDTVLKRREYYVLTYTRVINNAPVTPGEGKNSLAGDDGSGGSYTKKSWYTETVTFKINDSGIVGFELTGQLSIKETVVESAALQSFEAIKAAFEQMIAVKSTSEIFNKVIHIDRVTLGYTLVSEADSYDTGLLIPVWDFFGTVNCLMKDDGSASPDVFRNQKRIVLTVNAIDGSIIDRELGY